MSATAHDRDGLLRWIASEEAALAASVPNPVFSREEYASRQARVRTAMNENGIDALIVTSPDAMCWLHGYDSRWYRSHSSTSLPPTHATIVWLDDPRVVVVETQAHEHLVRLSSVADEFHGVPGSSIEVEPTLDEFVQFLVGDVVRSNVRTVGVERWSSVPNPATLARLEAGLQNSGMTVTDASAWLRACRRLKSAAEIALVERAQAACDAGVRRIQEQLTPGMSELDAWILFMSGCVAAGGEPTAMHETVAVGPPMPMLHRASSRRPIREGEYFHPDVAAAVHRYHARATRTMVLGTPAPEVVALAEILAGAFEVFEQVAQVGTTFGEVDIAVQRYFAAAGIQGWLGGYELGLSFPPDWVGEFVWGSGGAEADAVIEPGLVTNIESVGFLALVDTVVVDETGARLLSTLSRDVLVCSGRGT